MTTESTKKPTLKELKKGWQDKYGAGNCRELIADGKSVFVFDPTVDFKKMKIVFIARQQSVSRMVDAVLNNCWLGGDESLKQDESFKLGIEDQVEELMDIPESSHEMLPDGKALIKVEGLELEVKKVTRMDLRYADDRNLDNLSKRALILDRIADPEKVEEIKKKNPRAYFSMLLEVIELKEKKDVEIKKF